MGEMKGRREMVGGKGVEGEVGGGAVEGGGVEGEEEEEWILSF